MQKQRAALRSVLTAAERVKETTLSPAIRCVFVVVVIFFFFFSVFDFC